MTKDLDSLGMKVWVIPPGRESRLSKILAEDKGHMEWVVEDVILVRIYTTQNGCKLFNT